MEAWVEIHPMLPDLQISVLAVVLLHILQLLLYARSTATDRSNSSMNASITLSLGVPVVIFLNSDFQLDLLIILKANYRLNDFLDSPSNMP